MRKPSAFFAAALAIGLSSCSSEPSVSPTPVLTTIDVSLDASAIEVGQIIKVRAMPLDQDGVAIAAAAPIFESSDQSVAEVDPKTGDVRGISSGSTYIIATVGARSGSRMLVVSSR